MSQSLRVDDELRLLYIQAHNLHGQILDHGVYGLQRSCT